MSKSILYRKELLNLKNSKIYRNINQKLNNRILLDILTKINKEN